MCLESYLPQSTDLIILEHLPYLDSAQQGIGVAVERLILRLLLHFRSGKRPAILVLNMHRWARCCRGLGCCQWIGGPLG